MTPNAFQDETAISLRMAAPDEFGPGRPASFRMKPSIGLNEIVESGPAKSAGFLEICSGLEVASVFDSDRMNGPSENEGR